MVIAAPRSVGGVGMTQFPRRQRGPVALQLIAVQIQHAQRAATAAALVGAGLFRRLRTRIGIGENGQAGTWADTWWWENSAHR